MTTKCVYCKQSNVPDERPLTVCDVCGKSVWGEKMFRAIISNMEQAEGRGDLHQGSVN